MSNDFGCTEYCDELAALSPMLQKANGIVRSHRDLELFLNHYRQYGKEHCYIYTGRGPSTRGMHLGHTLPFMVTKILQRELGVRVIILLTDDEKFLFRGEHTLETYTEFARECRDEIMLLGLIPELTDIYIGTESIGRFYSTILKIQDRINFNCMSSVFGLDGGSSIGKVGFPAYEMAPCNPSTVGMPSNSCCLVICAKDQDPFFRVLRDHCGPLGIHKPSLLHLEYLPGLNGSEKMNSTAEGGDVKGHANTVIFLSDSCETIRTKITKFALSGGGATRLEHMINGANLDVDVAYKYLKFFLTDRVRFAQITQDYGAGRMDSSEVKKICIKVLCDMLAPFRPTV